MITEETDLITRKITYSQLSLLFLLEFSEL